MRTPLATLEREALRVYARYVEEFVEAHSLCPWASRARLEGHVKPRVVMTADGSFDEAVSAVRELSADENIHVALLIFPRLSISRVEFERFTSALRELDEDKKMAMAPFHPDAQPDLSSAERCVAFVRRSPDPTIQLVRLSILAEVRRPSDEGTAFMDPSAMDLRAFLARPPKPPLHERVANANLATLRALPADHAVELLDDIRRDRDAAYARVLNEEE